MTFEPPLLDHIHSHLALSCWDAIGTMHKLIPQFLLGGSERSPESRRNILPWYLFFVSFVPDNFGPWWLGLNYCTRHMRSFENLVLGLPMKWLRASKGDRIHYNLRLKSHHTLRQQFMRTPQRLSLRFCAGGVDLITSRVTTREWGLNINKWTNK